MWLNVATHIFPPKYEKFRNGMIYQSWLSHQNESKSEKLQSDGPGWSNKGTWSSQEANKLDDF